MKDSKLIIVDGINGSGKSTTAELISLHLQKSGIKARDILEDNRPNPVRMGDPFYSDSVDAWITEKINKWTIFAEELETSSEIVVLHGQLFHENIDSLLCFDTPSNVIRDIIDKILSTIRQYHPILIHLSQTDLREFIQQTFDDRGQQWRDMQINWKVHSRPFGQQREVQGVDGFIKLYSECRDLSDQVFEELDIEKLKIDVSRREWPSYTRKILEFLSERLEQQLDFNINQWSNRSNYAGDIGILRNPNTEHLHELNSLISVDRDLRIRENPKLETLRGLTHLEHIGGDFQISQNVKLKALDGLQSLSEIKGELQIVNNRDLRNLADLEELTKIGSLRVIGNPSLNNFCGLHKLHRIIGNFIIDDNANLKNLEGLESLGQIGEDFFIGGRTGNDSLIKLSGIVSLSCIGRHLEIRKNNVLKSLDGLNQIENIGGRLFIEENDELIDLNGISSLSSIGRKLRIAKNPKLKCIVGLSNLHNINGALEIIGNPHLESLQGLNRVRSIGGNITISECPKIPEKEITAFIEKMGAKSQK